VTINQRYVKKNSQAIKEGWAVLPLKMGRIGWPGTSVNTYNSRLQNIPEERRAEPADSARSIKQGCSNCGWRTSLVLLPQVSFNKNYSSTAHAHNSDREWRFERFSDGKNS
jgi:hypothetical protein